MHKARLETFSDGVVAILITIMVLELKIPHGADLAHLAELAPVFASYVLSFLYIAIYWNNHHHLFHFVEHIHGRTLWANLHWLFWMSLMPFATAWMGENGFARLPVAMYGVILLATACAYRLLTATLVAEHGRSSRLAAAIGSDRKTAWSMGVYAMAIVVAAWIPWLACALYAAVAAGWFIPDRRIERNAA